MIYVTVHPEEHPEACQVHNPNHVEFQSTGGWHFDGEPYDDIKEVDVCLDCGCEVEPFYLHRPLAEDEKIPF